MSFQRLPDISAFSNVILFPTFAVQGCEFIQLVLVSFRWPATATSSKGHPIKQYFRPSSVLVPSNVTRPSPFATTLCQNPIRCSSFIALVFGDVRRANNVGNPVFERTIHFGCFQSWRLRIFRSIRLLVTFRRPSLSFVRVQLPLPYDTVGVTTASKSFKRLSKGSLLLHSFFRYVVNLAHPLQSGA